MTKKYKYSYTISKSFNDDVFNKQCIDLEKKIEGIEKRLFLHDVDDTKIQFYDVDNNEIKVVNDFEVDVVYIDSDINLTKFLNEAL